MEDLTGKQFGSYQIVAPLGEGGMAAVYKAYQPAMERYVALKVLPRHMASSAEFLARFRREAKLLAQLQHPHILPVFDYGEADGYPYIVMPFVPSGTLAGWMQKQRPSLLEVRRIMVQIGDALSYAHARGMVHRDIRHALAWLLLGWGTTLRAWLVETWPPLLNPWLLVPAFAAIFAGLLAVITLPLGYYGGYVLPHRYGQSTQMLKGWISDQLKGLLVGAPPGLVLVELLYLALRGAGDLWWLWTAAGLLVFNVLLSNLAPVLIMPLFNKYVPLGEEHEELAQRLLRLAEKAQTRVRGVYKFDLSRRTRAANAALTGIGSTRRIILGDTLISEFSDDEIETVLAHELGHHVHRDILIYILGGALITTLGLYAASMAMRWAESHADVRDFGWRCSGTSGMALGESSTRTPTRFSSRATRE